MKLLGAYVLPFFGMLILAKQVNLWVAVGAFLIAWGVGLFVEVKNNLSREGRSE